MKSILLTVNNDSGLEARMQVSLDLVRATSGHLTCLNVTPPVEYIGVDTIGGTPLMVDLDHYYHTSAAELRTKVELKLAHEDVNWDYIHINDDVLGAVIVPVGFVIALFERNEFIGKRAIGTAWRAQALP